MNVAAIGLGNVLFRHLISPILVVQKILHSSDVRQHQNSKQSTFSDFIA